MPRKPDIDRIKATAVSQLAMALKRYDKANQDGLHYLLIRWIASMTAVEMYAVWERYAEKRLTVALVYHPQKFLGENNIKGVNSISVGLATALVRGGNRFFDFRSTSELIEKGDRFVDKANNPFRNISAQLRNYLDTLGAIRNYIVHQSEGALASYKRYLENTYGIKSKPGPEEFLNSIDYRKKSPAKDKSRLFGLGECIRDAVNLS